VLLDFFRNAAEPLFNTSLVDTAFGMDAVFPGCLSAPAFLNALLFSVVQMINKGKPTLEGLRLQGRALQCLRRTFASSTWNLSHPDIGAVMILQGVAASSQYFIIGDDSLITTIVPLE
jgi:hypothetical protein